jgi:hypothetical protein
MVGSSEKSICPRTYKITWWHIKEDSDIPLNYNHSKEHTVLHKNSQHFNKTQNSYTVDNEDHSWARSVDIYSISDLHSPRIHSNTVLSLLYLSFKWSFHATILFLVTQSVHCLILYFTDLKILGSRKLSQRTSWKHTGKQRYKFSPSSPRFYMELDD